jgi:hypothetical protein
MDLSFRAAAPSINNVRFNASPERVSSKLVARNEQSSSHATVDLRPKMYTPERH